MLVENCVLEDCGTHVNSLMTRPLQTDPDYNGAATFQIFSPLALDQASSVVVRNIAIRRTKAPAVAVSFAGSQYANGTALLENLLLENCAEKLADVRTEQTNST
ncbi:hypothetical protein HS125_17290 [bacterium]|nr:hypothetical protein [bacterium]